MTAEQQKSLDALVQAMQILANAHIQIVIGAEPAAPVEPTTENAEVLA